MRKLMLLVGLVLSCFLLHAQKNYAVMVKDSKTENPITGASVKIMSTGKTAVTGVNGTLVILASPTDSLQIRSKGYADRQIQLAGQSAAISIFMALKPTTPRVTARLKKKH